MMIPAVARVTARGQVTIPKAVREKYGLSHGAEVRIVDLDGSIMIVPQEPTSSINQMRANFNQVCEDLDATDPALDEMVETLKRIRDSPTVE